jgi:hypothetical protein
MSITITLRCTHVCAERLLIWYDRIIRAVLTVLPFQQVVGTADRQISVFNLSAPQTPYKQIQSPLKFQTRCVTCFPDTTGYLVGSIEVAISLSGGSARSEG